MAKFKMENFGGEIPAIDNRLMPENHAARSINTWLMTGRVEPLHALVELHTLRNQEALSFFRLPIATPTIDTMVNSYWLEFENQNVRVIASPVTGVDDGGRYYWADGSYPKYMTGDMIKNANADPPVVPYEPWKLGVPAPTVAPGVTTAGGTGTIQSRVYAYTWVTEYGEEGAPSPPTLANGPIDAVWTITMSAPTPSQTDHRSLEKTRIYRSVTSIQGVASYFFVAEIPIAQLTYDDTQTDAQITLNEQLQTIGWDEPPTDLQGLVSMPNGMVAAWRQNEVWFCEPYHPHAWPLAYMIAVPTDIVGLGVLGQTLIILTQGSPWSATGIDPRSMALAIIQPLEPCTSRLSIVNTPGGVLYTSPNGLINITAAGAQNVTKDIVLKDQWPNFLNLDSVCAAILHNHYLAYSITESEVFQRDTFQFDDETTTEVNELAFQEKSHFGTRPGIILSFSDPRVALSELHPGVEIHNLITDIFNSEAMILRDDGTGTKKVYLVDLRTPQTQAKYIWRSKMFKTDYLQNLGAAKVYWTPAVKTLPPQGNTVFRLYSAADSQEIEDGLTLRFEEVMTKSGQMFRLPSGYKALYWQFEIEGYAFIDAIHAASSPRELRGV